MRKLATFVLASAMIIGFTGVAARPAAAAALTPVQIQAVLALLESFGVGSTTVATVNAALTGTTIVTTTPANASTTAATIAMIGLLHRGDQGDQVKLLQTLLAADPSVYPAGIINGSFGPLTEHALKKYQEKHGLESVGFIGPKTLQRLDDDLQQNPIGLEDGSATSTSPGSHQPCAIIPPGHLIAPGWLKHHDGEEQIIPTCQMLPPGIAHHDDNGNGGGDGNDNENEHGGNGQGTTTPPVADTVAPILSSIVVGSIASTSATVSWQTNESATGKVYFGTVSTLDLGTALNVSVSALSLAHSLALTSLTASTTYFYVVESKDAAGNTATTSAASFVTTN